MGNGISIENCPYDRAEPLFKRELSSGATGQFKHPPICTITFFRGNINNVKAHIENRLYLVAEKNPWICGTLCKFKGESVQLVYPSVIERFHVEKILTIKETPVQDLSMKTEYSRLVDLSRKLAVGKGKVILQHQTPVTKCLLAPIDETSFAMIFSMSHVVADGFTYYEVLNSLADIVNESGELSPIPKIIPKRKFDYEKTQEKRLMGESDFKYGNSLAFIKSMVQGVFSKPKGRPLAFYVDKKQIDIAKSRVLENNVVPYVSSNDIITSHFLNSCDADISMMTINYRSRWEELQDATCMLSSSISNL